MKTTVSLRVQISGLMTLLVLLQSLSLLTALFLSRVFTKLDEEAFRLLNNTATVRMQAYNNTIGELVGNMVGEAVTLNRRLQDLALQGEVNASRLHMKNDVFDEVVTLAADSVISILKNNSVTGAYVVFAGSNTSKADSQAHSAVYIRNSAPNRSKSDNSNYLLEVGPIMLSQQNQIPASVNWDLDVYMEEDEDHSYYTQPLWASKQHARAEMERYGFWSPPIPVLNSVQPTVSYSLPLIDEAGEAYAVLGVEISLAHFNQNYLPNTDLPYPNSFYIIAPVRDGVLDLSWYIPSGPLAQVHLVNEKRLALEQTQDDSTFATALNVLGEMYCSVYSLAMYSKNSPFYDESWSLVCFVPQDMLHQSSADVRSTLNMSIGLTTAVSFVCLSLLMYFTTRKISGLSKYVKSLSPYQEIHFTHTGIWEIDELTAAVEMVNKSAISASKTTSKILELTLLPIGGFEISTENNHVVLTEYIYTLLGLEPGIVVTQAQWAHHYAEITKHAAEGYENIYRFTGEQDAPVKWLRILETKTDTGKIGVILDVSKDIEEHRRLANELDYDQLTHLYNRVAFKREATAKIQAMPEKMGAMIFADLDNLKYVNDNFGHDMGDRLIIRAGEMFREFERHGGVVSRISGDEFAIFLHGFSSKEEIRDCIDKQFKKNQYYDLIMPDGESNKIRSSSGIAWYPDDSDNITDLLKLSDFAMYEAKHSRKGSLFEFSHESYTKNAYLLENREAINRLLDEKLIRFAFQPIVDLRTGEVFAYEALMRPLLENFKSPFEILSVAAAQSKLGQLERLVMLSAFQHMDENKQLPGDTRIFINSIPSQILSDEDHLLLERKYAHLFERVVVEITEAESDSPQRMESKLAFIRNNGMRIAIDDFGSGYSNEVRILSMSPDIVKVDIALISGIDQDADKQKLVENLLSFCHSKGIMLVAEGVERAEELQTVIRLGMDYVQGYYIAKPHFDFLPIPASMQEEICLLQEQRNRQQDE